jgi:hypothetical protein
LGSFQPGFKTNILKSRIKQPEKYLRFRLISVWQIIIITSISCPALHAQVSATDVKPGSADNATDSLSAKAHGGFDDVSHLHRFFFGENYRKEWSADTKLPVIRISSFKGGLVPEREGGGNQTHSLRLKDKNGREWVLRSVEKYPDAILPDNLKKTFVKDIVTDAMSAQHPYSALIVPPIAHAVGVPHANPIIGIVAPDSALGKYSKVFAGTVCLLEEREPTGKSDNYTRMQEELNADNDNSFDSTTFLRARILDVFLGDWDRHLDQWRFTPEKYGKGIRYTGVPRDRDQVFYTNQGVFPYIESRPYVQPFFEGFNPKIRKVGTFLFTSTLLNVRLLNQFTYDQWMQITRQFVSEVTDSVLEEALRQLPKSSYDLRHDQIISIWKSRRADLPRAMSDYYYFLNKNVFIQTSNKDELVIVKDTLNSSLQVTIYKLSGKGNIKQALFSKTFDPAITKEIRFFIMGGNDSITIDNKSSPIKLRFAGGSGEKKYDLVSSVKKVAVFERKDNAVFTGDQDRFSKHLSNDSANTEIIPGDLFNVFEPVITGGYNPDDGILLGLSFKFFRGLDYRTTSYSVKKYASTQQFSFIHSFATTAFNAKYRGEWKAAVGKADLIIQASVFAPDNTQNFFGTGNETNFDKSGDYKTYYRSRFDIYQLNPSLRWGNKKGNYISLGPSLEFYTYDSTENIGRYIATHDATQTYDSATLANNKLHAGVIFDFNRDKRDNRLLPVRGYEVNVRLQGYAGLNSYSKSFAQLFADLVLYKSVNATGQLVFADRIGGGATAGNAAFYQSMFLGGQGNLLGYRQYRYAGQYMLYNNLEARLRLAQFANYILPGQLGLIGLYDIGRVWQKEDHSNQWHNGVGGGLYFAPAQMALIEFVMSYSPEGWYPALTFGFRF